MQLKQVGDRYKTMLTSEVKTGSVFDTQFFQQSLRVKVVEVEPIGSQLGKVGEVKVLAVLNEVL